MTSSNRDEARIERARNYFASIVGTAQNQAKILAHPNMPEPSERGFSADDPILGEVQTWDCSDVLVDASSLKGGCVVYEIDWGT